MEKKHHQLIYHWSTALLVVSGFGSPILTTFVENRLEFHGAWRGPILLYFSIVLAALFVALLLALWKKISSSRQIPELMLIILILLNSQSI
jgi:hypothetical protein